ncbi:MAG: HD domain-containing protein [bacterium]|nr:HD domain-containing protein [bacterium]
MRQRKEMLEEMRQWIEKIKDEKIRTVTLDIFSNPRLTFVDVQPKISFEESPAAPKHHHAYPGGLIDHLYGVLMIALKLAECYSSIYGFEIDLDLVIAGAVLHDIYKYYQYEQDPVTGGYRPRQDWYLSHEFAVVAELAHRKAPDRLLRCISEVHGTVPFTLLESQILHWADSTDANFIANLQNIIWFACREIETETNGQYLAIKTFYRALWQYPIFLYAEIYYKKGKDELRKFIKENVLALKE